MPSSEVTDALVLVVDDEPAMTQVLHTALSARSYHVEIAATGATGLELASALEPDVFVVDLGLPDMDGVEVCRQLRRWTANPIIVLTVDDGINRKVEALDAGADDYVTKPFSLPELLARIRVAVRHRHRSLAPRDASEIAVGNLQMQLDAHVALVAGEPLALTPKEFALLALLARNAGKVIPHRTLLVGVWGAGSAGRMEYLRTRVNQLRRKLEATDANVALLTESGVGYRLAIID